MGPLYLPVNSRQLSFYICATLFVLLFFFWDWKVAFTVLTFLLCAFYGLMIAFRLSSVLFAGVLGKMGKPMEHCITEGQTKALDVASLPVYTILVPMYKEPEVAQKIIRAVTDLDYPQDKLDVKLLLEEDDPETRAKIDAVKDQLPSCIEIIVCPKVPKGQPKTKPRACNWGLDKARGEYLVIFDAEDRPETDQLKKAVVAFRSLEAANKKHVVCLQAKLNYFNARQNLLTKCFTLEYTTWFDLFLPGLHAFRIPIPLGGTSNHFRTDMLKKLGGWDPFNVTEDCDLGIRLARHGYATEILDSTTWEEANSQVGNWIRQRSRWIKGYFQTHLVHTRSSAWPHLFLAAAFIWLGMKCSEVLARPEYSNVYGAAKTVVLICQLLAVVCVVTGVMGWLERLKDGQKRDPNGGLQPGSEGRLGPYHALTFRLTVGGLSFMLLLNVIFWAVSALYLFRHQVAAVLPSISGAFNHWRPKLLEGSTVPDALNGWQLFHQNMTDERFQGQGYTIWSVTERWLIQGHISASEAR